MPAKISISVTDEQLKLVNDAVAGGGYASVSEVFREALRDWSARRLVGELWDEGVASGVPDQQMTMEEIKHAGRRRRKRVA
jgi:antitoxin ParD1/3/4